ncbi:MAG: NAD(P)H-hydrate epimerase [Candidatus Nanohaloarchaea archaeon]
MRKVTRDEMTRLEDKAFRDYGLKPSKLMENAGYQIADFIRKNLEASGITVYAGRGNNGGDAFVAARRLHNWGFDVEVVTAGKVEGLPAEELRILEKLGIMPREEPEKDFSVALDGVIGSGLKGDPRPPLDSMIRDVNSHDTVVSIDIASGVDPDTGEEKDPCVRPDYTLTLGFPFEGLDAGGVYVVDISLPREFYEEALTGAIPYEEFQSDIQ